MTGTGSINATGSRLVATKAPVATESASSDTEMADLLLVIDASASIREISPSVRWQLGHRRGDLLGSDLFELLHPDDVALVRSLLRGDQSPARTDLRLRHQSGRWCTFSIQARKASGPDRQILLIIEGHDITESEPELLVKRRSLGERSGEFDLRSGEEALSPDLIERARAQAETVLVALDDPYVSATACSVMRQLGYTVIEASSPADAEGFARVHQGPIHLLVTDLATPRVRGRALVHAVQAIRPGLKSLFVSRQGYGSLAERRVYESGARLLHQPFTPEELAHSLRRSLESAKA